MNACVLLNISKNNSGLKGFQTVLLEYILFVMMVLLEYLNIDNLTLKLISIYHGSSIVMAPVLPSVTMVKMF